MTAPPITPSLFPIAALHECSLEEANACLVAWKHKDGPLTRPPEYGAWAYVLTHEGSAIAVATTSTLVRERVGGGLGWLTRDNTVELSRLCAVRPGLCRVMLRLWRELVFPTSGWAHAVSYQDKARHLGNTYRFDGWQRAGESSSGTDYRDADNPRKGKRKVIWLWPPRLDVAVRIRAEMRGAVR